jgi:hypothetical protein
VQVPDVANLGNFAGAVVVRWHAMGQAAAPLLLVVVVAVLAVVVAATAVVVGGRGPRTFATHPDISVIVCVPRHTSFHHHHDNSALACHWVPTTMRTTDVTNVTADDSAF